MNWFFLRKTTGYPISAIMMSSPFYLVLVAIVLLPNLTWSAEPRTFCFADESGPTTVYHCRDEKNKTSHRFEFEPLEAPFFELETSEKGVEFIDAEEFIRRTTLGDMNSVLNGNLMEPGTCGGPEQEFKSYYKVEEFKRLGVDHPVIQHLRELAQAMHDAGACSVPVRKENFNSIDVRSRDDLLQQFLCISNSESVFGQRNIGMGGRGPWGIHPMHNQKKGSRAYVDGKTTRLKQNGICYPSQAVVRDADGEEIKINSRYFDEEVIFDNAKCALKLYQREGSLGGFSAWGKGKSWGSNRHCSKKTRDRLNFSKYLGKLACCSKECIDKVEQSDSI